LSEAKTGQAKLFDASTSKGTAFTHAERRKFGLLGLLPTAEKTLAEQVEHCWCEFSTRRDDLENYIYLRALHDRPTLPKLRSQQFARAWMNHSDGRFRWLATSPFASQRSTDAAGPSQPIADNRPPPNVRIGNSHRFARMMPAWRRSLKVSPSRGQACKGFRT
jgi:hypothetical protein